MGAPGPVPSGAVAGMCGIQLQRASIHVLLITIHGCDAVGVLCGHVPDPPQVPALRVKWDPRDPPGAVVSPDTSGSDGTPGDVTPPAVASTKPLSDSQRELLACMFAAVKALFVAGALPLLPRCVELVECVRRGRTLHTTTIRNEHAYYCCVAQLLKLLQDGTPTVTADGGTNDSGDASSPTRRLPGLGRALTLPSPTAGGGGATAGAGAGGAKQHSLAPSWHRGVVCGEQRLLVPALVTGLKAWHIRSSSTFYPKRNYEAVRSAPYREARRWPCCSVKSTGERAYVLPWSGVGTRIWRRAFVWW